MTNAHRSTAVDAVNPSGAALDHAHIHRQGSVRPSGMRKRIDPMAELRALERRLQEVKEVIKKSPRALTDADVKIGDVYLIQVTEKNDAGRGRVHYVPAKIVDRGTWERGSTTYRLERTDRDSTNGPPIFRTVEQLWRQDEAPQSARQESTGTTKRRK
jgi:hypothetical protein